MFGTIKCLKGIHPQQYAMFLTHYLQIVPCPLFLVQQSWIKTVIYCYNIPSFRLLCVGLSAEGVIFRSWFIAGRGLVGEWAGWAVEIKQRPVFVWGSLHTWIRRTSAREFPVRAMPFMERCCQWRDAPPNMEKKGVAPHGAFPQTLGGDIKEAPGQSRRTPLLLELIWWVQAEDLSREDARDFNRLTSQSPQTNLMRSWTGLQGHGLTRTHSSCFLWRMHVDYSCSSTNRA